MDTRVKTEGKGRDIGHWGKEEDIEVRWKTQGLNKGHRRGPEEGKRRRQRTERTQG